MICCNIHVEVPHPQASLSLGLLVCVCVCVCAHVCASHVSLNYGLRDLPFQIAPQGPMPDEEGPGEGFQGSQRSRLFQLAQ